MSTHNWRDRRLQGEFNAISALRAASQSRGEATSVAAMDERIQAQIFADQTGDGAMLNFMDLNAGFDAATPEKFAAGRKKLRKWNTDAAVSGRMLSGGFGTWTAQPFGAAAAPPAIGGSVENVSGTAASATMGATSATAVIADERLITHD
eukprot:SAG11_NODE_16233_length_553_cov_1.649780_1_plen_149_part_10